MSVEMHLYTSLPHGTPDPSPRQETSGEAQDTLERIQDILDDSRELRELAVIEGMINERDFVRMPHADFENMQEECGTLTDDDNMTIQQLAAGVGSPREVTREVAHTNNTNNPTDAGMDDDNVWETDTPINTPDNRSDSDEPLDLIDYHFLLRTPEAEGHEGEDMLPPEPIPAFDDLSSAPSVGNVPSMPTTPPPTYAEAMKDAIPLSFIDFWPQCVNLNDENFLLSKFETFDRVIDATNSWLLEQSNVVIRNCETIETKASSLDEFIVLTATKTSTFKSSCRPLLFIKGLRVWYSSKIIDKLPFAFAVTPLMISYQNYKSTLVNTGDHLEYEKFPSLIQRCNSDIQSGKIKGRILNVETVFLKEPDFDETNHRRVTFDPDDSTWRDFYSKTALQLLRIYYIPEQPSKEELHFKDFLPERSRRKSKFRDFTTVMDDCRLWMVHLNSRYRIINAQTLEMKYVSKELGKMDPQVTYFSDYEGLPRVRFLRIYFASDLNDERLEYGAPLLSHKTFIPAPLKKKRHETLAALMHRVETWLRATGATVVCAETLPMLEQVYQEKNDADFSLYRSEWMEANTEYDHETLLYVVRVYLDTVYPEPPPQIFLDGEDTDVDCVLL